MIKSHTIRDQTDIKKYDLAMKMVSENNPRAFVTFRYHINNDNIQVEYITNHLMPLKEYLQRKLLSEYDIALLFINILEMIKNTFEMYLSPMDISLTLDEIFMDGDKNMPKFIYSPTFDNVDDLSNENRIAQVFRELIYEHIRCVDGVSNSVKLVINYINEPSWHIKGLLYKLKEYIAKIDVKNDKLNRSLDKFSNDKNIDMAVHSIQHEIQHPEKLASLDDLFGKYNKQMISNDNRIKQNNLKKLEKKDINDDENSKHKNQKIAVIQIITYIILAVFIGLSLAMLIMIPMDYTKKIGLFIILSAVIALIYRKALKNINIKDNNSTINVQTLDKNKLSKSFFGKNNIKHIRNNHKESYADKLPLEGLIDKKVGIVNDQQMSQTVIMPKHDNRCFLKTASGEEIALIKSKILVGRDEQTVDICLKNNLNIGRHHAELIRVKSGYAIQDLKSINGTYVGNLQVKPSEAIALMDGDNIRFANVEYTYHSWT